MGPLGHAKHKQVEWFFFLSNQQVRRTHAHCTQRETDERRKITVVTGSPMFLWIRLWCFFFWWNSFMIESGVLKCGFIEFCAHAPCMCASLSLWVIRLVQKNKFEKFSSPTPWFENLMWKSHFRQKIWLANSEQISEKWVWDERSWVKLIWDNRWPCKFTEETKIPVVFCHFQSLGFQRFREKLWLFWVKTRHSIFRIET